MEKFDKDGWLWSIMNTKKLTHSHRVVAWHMLQMMDDEAFVPYSMMEMGRKIGFTVDRSHICKAMYALKRYGYVSDLGSNLSTAKHGFRRFKLTMPQERNGRAAINAVPAQPPI